MKRRKFLMLTTAGIAVAGSAYLYLSYKKNNLGDSPWVPHALFIMMDPETINAIGKNYLNRFPGEANEDKLLKLLGAKVENERIDALALKNVISNDFKTGQTVVINGWVLSHTEARQCALFSITKTK